MRKKREKITAIAELRDVRSHGERNQPVHFLVPFPALFHSLVAVATLEKSYIRGGCRWMDRRVDRCVFSSGLIVFFHLVA